MLTGIIIGMITTMKALVDAKYFRGVSRLPATHPAAQLVDAAEVRHPDAPPRCRRALRIGAPAVAVGSLNVDPPGDARPPRSCRSWAHPPRRSPSTSRSVYKHGWRPCRRL